MAIHRAEVTGTSEVNGVAPGGTVELDDDVINVEALRGEHVRLLPPEPKKKTSKKGDA